MAKPKEVSTIRYCAIILLGVALVPMHEARADEPPLETDRPTKSDVPFTVPAGMFQYEADTPIVTRTGANQYAVDSVFKLGLNNWADAELAVTPLIADRTGRGIGDIAPRVKFNLFGNDDNGVALAIIPYVKIPTATHRFGNGQVEGGVLAPLSAPLPGGFTVTVMPEIDDLKNLQNAGYHANVSNLINISHPLFGDFTLYAELYGSVATRDGGKAAYSNDYAIAYAVTRTFQIDMGANIGLSSATPSMQYYFGISERF